MAGDNQNGRGTAVNLHQQTGLSAGTVTDDDQLSAKFSRHGSCRVEEVGEVVMLGCAVGGEQARRSVQVFLRRTKTHESRFALRCTFNAVIKRRGRCGCFGKVEKAATAASV